MPTGVKIYPRGGVGGGKFLLELMKLKVSDSSDVCTVGELTRKRT